MDPVYYIDDKNAHGSEMYYEYPNVFAAVLIDKYLGLTIPAEADVAVAPHRLRHGRVRHDRVRLRYPYTADGFVLKNLSNKPRRYVVDLSALGFASTRYRLTAGSKISTVSSRATITLAPQQQAHWTPEPAHSPS